MRSLVRRQRRTSKNAGTGSLPDLVYTDRRRVTSVVGCKMCSKLWDHFAGRSINNSTVNIKLGGRYLESEAARSCALCSVISNAVNEAISDSPIESVSLHTSSVGGPLDMVMWLVNGDTRSFELYTHPGR